MPKNVETRVLETLAAIEVPANAAERIVALGNEAVTVLCEAALGAIPGLRAKTRTNAAALVGRMDHPQAIETLALLIGDAHTGVASRALRAIARRRDRRFVERLGQVFADGDTSPYVAAEAVAALVAIDSAEARSLVSKYRNSGNESTKHRRSPLVKNTLDLARRR